jgi:hypothetical protein
MNQQQGQGQDPSGTNGVAKIFFVCRALAVSIEVFLHRAGSFGERYVGTQSSIALVLIGFFPVFWPTEDPRPILWFDAAFFLRCMMIRTCTIVRRIRGRTQPHSYYSGWPWMLGARSRVPESRVKGFLEPLIVAVAGLLLQPWNQPLGTYLVIAAVALCISVQASVSQDRSRALDLNDAMADQRRIAEQWRGMRHN